MKKSQNIPWGVLLFSQIFGAFPLKYGGKPNRKYHLEYSPQLAKWGISSITFLSFMTFVMVYVDITAYLNGNPIRMGNVLGLITILMDVTSLLLMASTVAVTCNRKYSNYLSMCRILEKVDNTLKFKFETPQMLLQVLFALFFITAIILWTIVLRMDEDERVILYMFPACFYYVQAALFMNFTYTAKALVKRFLLINETLQKEMMDITSSQNVTSSSLLGDISGDPEQAAVNRISLVIDCYSQLYEAGQLAESFYRSQLFTALTSSFLHNTVTLYFFITNVQQNGFVLANILREGVWVVAHLGHLILLVFPSNKLTKVAGGTATIVVQMMNKELKNEKLKDELELFLLKLVFYNAGFSGMGFFRINNQLLTSIASSISTYLVTLLEWNKKQ